MSDKLINEYVEKYVDITLNTKELDKTTAESAVLAHYDFMGFDKPEISYAASPQAAFSIAMKKRLLKNNQDATFDDFKSYCNNNLSEYFGYMFGGIFYTPWLSSIQYSKDNENLECKELENLTHFHNLVVSNGGVWMDDGFAIISDLPVAIRFDEDGNLHGGDLLAVEYKDGSGLAFWHGKQFPNEWITDGIDLDSLFSKTTNLEHAAIAYDLIGWDKVLDHFNAELIDGDNDEIGKLYSVEVTALKSPRSSETRKLKMRVHKVKCKTGRIYGIPIDNEDDPHPEVKTALNAHNWIYSEVDLDKPYNVVRF